MVLWVLSPCVAIAEDFLGLPIMPDGEVISETDDRLEKVYDVPFEKALNFYRETLKDEKDIKFRERGPEEMIIEEHGARPWHSISISQVSDGKTNIVFLKDNWTWILGTLTLRFFGVFAVLVVLYIVLEISGAIISRVVKVEGQ